MRNNTRRDNYTNTICGVTQHDKISKKKKNTSPALV